MVLELVKFGEGKAAAIAVLALIVASGCSRESLERQLLNEAIEGDRLAVEAALAAGADPNYKTEEGRTVLMWVAATAHAHEAAADAVTSALLDAGADPTARAADNSTALHWAANTGTLQLARQLVEAGADVNALTDSGWSPLNAAEVAGNTEIENYLIAMGASPYDDAPLQTAKVP